jgi:ADP-heptose:LPS heptosyltransferase
MISLQKGEESAQLKDLGWDFIDWMEECEDFLDTAGLINELDLVISVDTSVAHLAGALGKPVWLLNRFESEWRWMLERTDSPWYPGMKIFRQQELGNWESAINLVAEELVTLTRIRRHKIQS